MVVGPPGYRIGNGPRDWMHQANNRRRRRGNSRHKPLCRVGLKGVVWGVCVGNSGDGRVGRATWWLGRDWGVNGTVTGTVTGGDTGVFNWFV